MDALDASVGPENYQILEMLIAGTNGGPSSLTDAQTWLTFTGNRPVIMHDNGVAGGALIESFFDFDLDVTPSFVVVDPSLRIVRLDGSSGSGFDVVSAVQDTLTAYTNPTPPSAMPDEYVGSPGDLLDVDAANGVLANDFDPNGDPMTAILDTTTSNGPLNLNPDGSFTYTPPVPFDGESFTYHAMTSDGVSATVTVQIRSVGDYVIANDDFYNVPADILYRPRPRIEGPPRYLTDNDEGSPEPLEPDGGGGALVSVTHCAGADGIFHPIGMLVDTLHGEVRCSESGNFEYEPDMGYRGPDSFQYQISTSWGGQDTDTATVSLEVTERPTLQSASWWVWVDQANFIFDELLLQAFGNPISFPDVYVSANPSGLPLTLFVVVPPAQGELDFEPDGQLTYTPGPGFSALDFFWIQASDGQSVSDPVRINLEETPAVNARNDVYATGASETLVVPAKSGVLANDEDPQGFPLDLLGYGEGFENVVPVGMPLTLARGGTVTMEADGSFTYVPPSMRGSGPLTELFFYEVDSIPPEPAAEIGSAAVIINVDGVPSLPPSADAGGPYSANIGEAILLDGTGSSDPDMDVLSYSWSATAGSFNDPTLVSPVFVAPNNVGPVTVTLMVDDGNGGTDMDSAEVLVFDEALLDGILKKGFESPMQP